MSASDAYVHGRPERDRGERFNEAEACLPRMRCVRVRRPRRAARFNEAEACLPRMHVVHTGLDVDLFGLQ